MSENLLALILTLAILAAIAAWVPTTNFCHARCQEFLGRRKTRVQVDTPNEAATSDLELSA